MEGERERGVRGVRGTFPVPGHQGSVLQFFCKLRRHASLEGAGPYFMKWKFDSSHRATSLDAKGERSCSEVRGMCLVYKVRLFGLLCLS